MKTTTMFNVVNRAQHSDRSADTQHTDRCQFGWHFLFLCWLLITPQGKCVADQVIGSYDFVFLWQYLNMDFIMKNKIKKQKARNTI